MGWRNKIDIMATGFLQIKHGLGQLFIGYFLTLTLLADIVILAKITSKIAMREKNGA